VLSGEPGQGSTFTIRIPLVARTELSQEDKE